MRHTFFVTVIMLCFALLPTTIRAQTFTEDETRFWADLNTTANLLQQAITAANPSSVLSPARNLWTNIGSVRTSDGTVISVDLDWLRTGLSSNDPDALKNLHSSVQAILNYHREHATGTGRDLLGALTTVLQDPRFHYVSTPTPQPQPTSAQPPPPQSQPDVQPLFSTAFAQMALLLVGVVIVGLLLFNFLRQLRIQRATLPEPPPEDDPTTSEDARDRAAGSEADQDYRTAIRYLYLASLLLLDERGVIHYDRTLTNREHLRQVASNQELSNALRPVVNTFDRVWYGFAAVNEAMYEQFRQDVERLRGIAP